MEDAPLGTTIFQEITVTDRDLSGNNLEVECLNLPEYQDACDFFTINTVDSTQSSYHGGIVLNKKLNYTIQRVFQFLLKATVSYL